MSHHYVSTFCIHDLHTECRLTCKTCKSQCLCVCHRKPPIIDEHELVRVEARDALITVSHDYNGIRRWRLIRLREAVAKGVPVEEAARILEVTEDDVIRWCQ